MSNPGNSGKRASLIVRLGRIYQNISPLFSWIDYVFRNPLFLNKKNQERPVIILLSPPRSGSTLTYQVLRSGIKSFYLSNLWNLLFATPTFGGLISNGLFKNTSSSFQSDQGFVSGLGGEAEGLKFWSYWSGQTLDEANSKIDEKKLKKIAGILQRLKVENGSAFISGYLPHVFCINALRKVFPKVLFIHLERDLLSTCYSIYKLAPEEWMSVRPANLSEQISEKISRHEAIVKQVMTIHNIIKKDSQQSDTMKLSFADLCQNPELAIGQIISEAAERGIILQKKKDNLPESFNWKKTDPALNKDTEQLQYYINKAMAKA